MSRASGYLFPRSLAVGSKVYPLGDPKGYPRLRLGRLFALEPLVLASSDPLLSSLPEDLSGGKGDGPSPIARVMAGERGLSPEAILVQHRPYEGGVLIAGFMKEELKAKARLLAPKGKVYPLTLALLHLAREAEPGTILLFVHPEAVLITGRGTASLPLVPAVEPLPEGANPVEVAMEELRKYAGEFAFAGLRRILAAGIPPNLPELLKARGVRQEVLPLDLDGAPLPGLGWTREELLPPSPLGNLLPLALGLALGFLPYLYVQRTTEGVRAELESLEAEIRTLEATARSLEALRRRKEELEGILRALELPSGLLGLLVDLGNLPEGVTVMGLKYEDPVRLYLYTPSLDLLTQPLAALGAETVEVREVTGGWEVEAIMPYPERKE